jgi:uncharacterized protein
MKKAADLVKAIGYNKGMKAPQPGLNSIYDALLSALPPAEIVQVEVGLFWTAVVAEVNGVRKCGLAATLQNPEYEYSRLPVVNHAGKLETLPVHTLAELVRSESFTEAAIGMAAINALLPLPTQAEELSAEEYIARQGSQSDVALVGHFPFVADLRSKVRNLWVLELDPQEGDLPASQAPQVIPQASILAITATTLINHTFDGLFALRRSGAKVLLLGPSTPLAQPLFDQGVHVLSGTVVDDIPAVLALLRQGATFRQMRKAGVRLITLAGSS